jgi:hypothetical protein
MPSRVYLILSLRPKGACRRTHDCLAAHALRVRSIFYGIKKAPHLDFYGTKKFPHPERAPEHQRRGAVEGRTESIQRKLAAPRRGAGVAPQRRGSLVLVTSRQVQPVSLQTRSSPAPGAP